MKILGLYDEKNGQTEGALAALADWAKTQGHELSALDASELELKPCLGCFGCWHKTPGICVIPGDDGRGFVEALAPVDLLVVVTPIPFGSYAPSVKRALDRSIPVLLPFFTIHKGEMHHRQRYPQRRRILHLPYGDFEARDLTTFTALAAAHCDNLLSPHAKTQFVYRENPQAFQTWLQEEVGA